MVAGVGTGIDTSAIAGSPGSSGTRRDAWMSTRVAPSGLDSDATTVTGPVMSAVGAARVAGASRRRSISAASIPSSFRVATRGPIA